MAQEDDHKRTIVYGDAALKYIRKNVLPAYPRFYELWYTYAAGFNHSLNRAVNEIVGAKGTVTTEQLQQIYNSFLSPTKLGDRIDDRLVALELVGRVDEIAPLIITGRAFELV